MTQCSSIFSLPELKSDLSENLPQACQNKSDLVVIGERKYQLNKSKSKFVSTGLSYDYWYAPCIKLTGNRLDTIIFEESEWNDFLRYQGIITNYLYTNDKAEQIDAENFTIQFEKISYSRVIKIVKNNSYIYLGYESICKLWEALPLIKYRIEMLKRQQFASYFKIVQNGLQRQSGDVFENAMNLLKPLENCNNDNVCMLMELIYIYPEIFEVECCGRV